MDKRWAADYEGYLLWRLVLFKAHESTGTAGWSNPNDLEPAHLFAMMLLTTLEFEVLGIDMFEEISANLRGGCDRLFGPRPMARVLKIVRTSFPLDSTEAAVELAHKVMRCIRAEKNKALKAVEEAAGEGSTDNFEFRQGEGQSLLFDDDRERGLERAQEFSRSFQTNGSGPIASPRRKASASSSATVNPATAIRTSLRPSATSPMTASIRRCSVRRRR